MNKTQVRKYMLGATLGLPGIAGVEAYNKLRAQRMMMPPGKLLLDKPGIKRVSLAPNNEIISVVDNPFGLVDEELAFHKAAALKGIAPKLTDIRDLDGFKIYHQENAGLTIDNIAKRQAISRRQAFDLGRRTREADERLQDIGMLHGDIHPGNVALADPRNLDRSPLKLIDYEYSAKKPTNPVEEASLSLLGTKRGLRTTAPNYRNLPPHIREAFTEGFTTYKSGLLSANFNRKYQYMCKFKHQ